MAIYICKCGALEVEAREVTIRVVEGKAVNNLTCLDCGEYLELKNPKLGQCAGFSSNQYGQL